MVAKSASELSTERLRRAEAHGQVVDLTDEPEQVLPTARENESTSAYFDDKNLDNPFAQGAFRWVALGEYDSGHRTGEKCVAKWFKKGAVFEQEFFESDIKAVGAALEVVEAWNELKRVKTRIRVNIPAVFTIEDCPRRNGQLVLQEPYIEGFQKFNSNTGWVPFKKKDDSSRWLFQTMQALSHFSYHHSAGRWVLCDLQGGIDKTGVTLTDPVILSYNKAYGVTDLGRKGISSFFANHRCNHYCKSSWIKPAQPVAYFKPVESSTMMSSTSRARNTVPTSCSRGPRKHPKSKRPRASAIPNFHT